MRRQRSAGARRDPSRAERPRPRDCATSGARSASRLDERGHRVGARRCCRARRRRCAAARSRGTRRSAVRFTNWRSWFAPLRGERDEIGQRVLDDARRRAADRAGSPAPALNGQTSWQTSQPNTHVPIAARSSRGIDAVMLDRQVRDAAARVEHVRVDERAASGTRRGTTRHAAAARLRRLVGRGRRRARRRRAARRARRSCRGPARSASCSSRRSRARRARPTRARAPARSRRTAASRPAGRARAARRSASSDELVAHHEVIVLAARVAGDPAAQQRDRRTPDRRGRTRARRRRAPARRRAARADRRAARRARALRGTPSRRRGRRRASSCTARAGAAASIGTIAARGSRARVAIAAMRSARPRRSRSPRRCLRDRRRRARRRSRSRRTATRAVALARLRILDRARRDTCARRRARRRVDSM